MLVVTTTPTSIPAPTTTPQAVATPASGGADMAALLRANDIWVMNLDGGGLRQLTFDGLPKSDLHWSPEGDGLIYKVEKTVKFTPLEGNLTKTLASFPEVGYFNAFQVSPSGKWVALSLGQQLYVVPYNLEALSKAEKARDLLAMEGLCLHYTIKPVKSLRWSQDETRLAIEYLKLYKNTYRETIGVLDLGNCGQTTPLLLDEFPLDKFDFAADIVSYNWDGRDIFALNNNWRNGGFGDLYLYHTGMQYYRKIAPIENACCYRDAAFSPDGKYLFFAFQDMSLGSESVTKFYYIPVDINGGFGVYAPIPLPEGFFRPQDAPHPVLRAARP